LSTISNTDQDPIKEYKFQINSNSK